MTMLYSETLRMRILEIKKDQKKKLLFSPKSENLSCSLSTISFFLLFSILWRKSKFSLELECPPPCVQIVDY